MESLTARKGSYLSVVGQDEDETDQVWVCVSRQHLNQGTNSILVEWLEQVEVGVYIRSGQVDRIQASCILSRVRLVAQGRGDTGEIRYLLPASQLEKAERCLRSRGEEDEEGEEEEEEEEDEKMDLKSKPKSRKRKHDQEKKKVKVSKKKEKTTKSTKKTKNKVKKEKKKTEKKEKVLKAKKPKIDKTNPNWKLKPNLSIKVWEKEPLCEGVEEVPFVSSTAQSRLVIRAVLTNNLNLLRACVSDYTQISSLHTHRSLALDMTGFRYALKNQHLEFLKIFLKAETDKKPRCKKELCILPTHGTGTYNYRSLGIRNIRKVNLSRGSREGNNAFTKDQNIQGEATLCASDMMRWNLGIKFISNLILISKKELDKFSFISNVYEAVRNGHRELAAHFISQEVEMNGNQFSKFFVDSLLGSGDPWNSTVREVSARKKAGHENRQITPLHTACINPDTGPLEALYQTCPDLFLTDSDQWKPIHYASASATTGALDFLEKKGANLEDPAKDGLTPLMVACKAGRPDSVRFLLDKLCSGLEDEESYSVKKFGRGRINKPGRDSWSPIHLAVSEGHLETVAVLLKYGADANRPLNTRYDKMTPLMLAAANGDLDMVKLLVSKALIEKKDRFHRTALSHGVINGAAHVVSFLLSLGADPNGKDSSQNSNLHYACAYGWWFCMKVLLESGANLNSGNEWNLTPLSVAFLKGNKGIGKHLAELPGVNIEVRDDKGRTILLNMLDDNGEHFSNEKMKEVFAFIKEHNANPAAVDNDGNTALHYIMSHKLNSDPNVKSFMARILKMVNFFLAQGVSPYQRNKNGLLPVQVGFSNKYSQGRVEDEEESKPHFQALSVLLSGMIKDRKSITDNPETLMRDLMRDFLMEIEVKFGSLYLETFKEINKLILELVEVGELSSIGFMDKEYETITEERTISYTVFSKLCKKYQSVNIETETDSTLSIDQRVDCWKPYLEIVRLFITTFSPRFELKVEKDKYFFALLSFARAQDKFQCFNMIMNMNPDVSVKDKSSGMDALYILIERGFTSGVKLLLKQGANPNRIRVLKKEKKEIKDTPLLWALNFSNLDLITTLVESGAKVCTKDQTGVSSLHKAVLNCAKNKTKNNLEIIRLLLNHGVDVNETDDKLRTPMHVAVNSGTADPDSSLDLEMFLLRRGGSLSALDIRGRIPLHYAFVKAGQHKNTTMSDPIQIVSALVESSTPDLLNTKDNFGCIPLHYAAVSGATVCSLLLLEKGSNLESRDLHSQTPLCYAVLGKHYSCSLILIQKDANLDVLVQPDLLQEKQKTVEKHLWKFLPEHFPKDNSRDMQSLFQQIVLNEWLGIIYVVLAKFEKFGIPFVTALEVSIRLQKFQFAKTLISKQTDFSKLQGVISEGRNLLSALTYESYGLDQRKTEIAEDVLNMLVEAGLTCDLVDVHGCTPFHYACLNKNSTLIQNLLLRSDVIKSILNISCQGKSALAAYFWISKSFSDEDFKTLQQLFEAGLSVNEKFPVPAQDFISGDYTSTLTRENFCFHEVLDTVVTPLILAISRRDLSLIKYLLKHGADPNLEDSQGNSSLVYAVKTNDVEIIDEVLAWVDTQLTGVNVLLHTIALDPENPGSPSFDNLKVFKKLLNKHNTLTNNQENELARAAMRNGALNIFNSFPANVRTQIGKKLSTVQENGSGLNTLSQDYNQDAKIMLRKLESGLRPPAKKEKAVQSGCVVSDGEIYQDYQVLLNKVDVSAGAWGLYNFYRMQIWKDNTKDLYVLFTNWGRIESYSSGQFQNTPYSKPEDAVVEFKKIFKSKTGNDWENVEKFQNQAKKYRLVKVELTERIKKPEVKLNLKTDLPLQLPLPLAHLLHDMSDFNMLRKSFSHEVDIDSSCISFGRIDRTVVEKAKELLEKIKSKVEKREKIEATKYAKAITNYDELGRITEELCEMSSEYYHLVPKEELEYEKLSPIDSLDTLREEMQRMNYILEFEFSEALLLGAMYRRTETHPLDYIYAGLGARIQLLEESSIESQLLMKYMYKSRGAAQVRVQSIFSVDSDNYRSSITPTSTSRVLLWHGTKRANLASILRNGLAIDPPYSIRTGRMYGNGVYLADMFDKSISYCDHGRESKVLLLVEADLGKNKVHNDEHYYVSEESDHKKFDSLHVQGSNGPDKKGEISSSDGVRIPTGNIIKVPNQKTKTSWGHWDSRPSMSEYIVFNESKVRIRYLVCVGNKSRDMNKLLKTFSVNEEEMEVDDEREHEDKDEDEDGDGVDNEDEEEDEDEDGVDNEDEDGDGVDNEDEEEDEDEDED